MARVRHGSCFHLVFHGGSGSDVGEIREAMDYGVVKMNIDTDTQYAFTRAIADHMFRNYGGVLKVDGEVGDKKAYDPRSYLASAEMALAERVRKVGNRAARVRYDDGEVIRRSRRWPVISDLYWISPSNTRRMPLSVTHASVGHR